MNQSPSKGGLIFVLVLLLSACSSPPKGVDSVELNQTSKTDRSMPTPPPVPESTPDPMQEILTKGRNVKGKLQLPTVINAEDRFINPVKMPDDVLQFVRNLSELTKDCKEPVQAINECFAIVQVDLNEDSLADFILFGRGRNGGANVAPFYVFAGTKDGLSLVLEDVKLQVEIQSKKTKGNFDIVAAAVTANILFTSYYTYNGKTYVLKRKVEEKL